MYTLKRQINNIAKFGILLLWQLLSVGMAQPTQQLDEMLIYNVSGQNIIIHSKQPMTKWRIYFDNLDVTALARLNDSKNEISIVYSPPAGEHKLLVNIITVDGLNIRRQFSITTQGSYFSGFSTLGFESGIAPLGQDDAISTQAYYVNSDIYNNTRWRNGNWNTQFNARANYVDQGFDLYPIRDDQLYVSDFLLTSQTTRHGQSFQFDFGDLSTNATPLIAQNLARRGGRFHMRSKSWTANLFSVTGDSVLSFEQGTGLNSDNKHNLQGITGEYLWTNNHYRLLGAYITGGRNHQGLGSSGAYSPNQGQAGGVLLTMNPWTYNTTIELEYDKSLYDDNTTDLIKAKKDAAYAMRVKGQQKKWRYVVNIERIGSNYATVANETLQNDRQSVYAGILYTHKQFMFDANAETRYDNLIKDSTRPRVTNRSVFGRYSYSGIQDTYLQAYLSFNQLNTSREPVETLEQRVNTQETGIHASHHKKHWGLDTRWHYTFQNDLFDDENDTYIHSVMFAPDIRCFGQYLATPVSLTRIDSGSGNDTRMYSASLLLNGYLFRKNIIYQWQGNYSVFRQVWEKQKHYLFSDGRITYQFQNISKRKFVPAIGLRGKVVRGASATASNDINGWMMWLIFSLSAAHEY